MKHHVAVSLVQLSTANIQYSTVCGRITAYQVGSPDDFRAETNDINSAYVDGVSLTHGNPRQHIWTFAAAVRMNRICDDCCNEPRPTSVGSDFFCDSGNPMSSSDTPGTSIVPTLYGMGLDVRLIMNAVLLTILLTSSRHYHSPPLTILR